MTMATEPAGGTAAPGATTERLHAEDPRIDRALDALPLGVVVTDADGFVVYQNQFAHQFDRARHGDALVRAGIDQVVTSALRGVNEDRAIDLYGPPARNLLLRASPTYDPDDTPNDPSTDEPDPRSAPADGGGELTGSVVLIEDVTAAHQLDRIRKDFVANVSHELRTPIGAIGVLAETLRDAEDPEVVDRLAGRLHNEALRLGHVIEDLLALSRVESGRIEDPQLVDLHDVISLAVQRAEPGAEQRSIAIHAPPEGREPVLVRGDQSQLVSAVSNLLDNAVKYSEIGDDVTVEVARTADEATIAVADHGVGIPASAHQRIFERFYRVDDARSRATGGTGLGLSIVRHVVINHEGSISVASTEGQGSTFTIRLPLAGR
ncbi:MAG: ATP-binding protein [Acidimicrobiales bacterium]